MTAVVCDASVLFKLLVDEDDADLAKSLASSCSISAPDIAVAEIGNALWARIRNNRLNAPDGEELIERFHAMPLDLRPSRPLVGQALRIAHRIKHPIYDCLYLALAESLEVPLVSADRRFVDVARRSGIATAEMKLLSEFT